MLAPQMDDARRVRDYWFGKLPLDREALDERMTVWFAGEESGPLAQEQDAVIRSEFGARVEAALRGELASWADGPRRRLSLILLLDQFPRHIFRGRARAYAGDEQALALALSGMQSGADAALDPVDYLDHCWSLEPFAPGGPTAAVPPGSWTRFGRWLHQPVGPIHWAGSETADEWTGFMDGAVRSGRRAAAEVADRLAG